MTTNAVPKERKSITLYLLTFAGRAVRGLGRLGLFWMAAARFSPAEVGLFVFLLAMGRLATVLSDVGLGEFVSRELPASHFRELPLVRGALRARSLFAVLASAITFAVLLALGVPALAAAGVLAFSAASGLGDLLAAVARARGANHLDLVDSSVPIAGALVAAAIAFVAGLELPTFLAALGAGAALPVLIRFVLVERWLAAEQRRLGVPASRTVASMSSVAWRARWFYFHTLAMWALSEVGILILEILSTSEQQSLLGAALRIVGIATQPYVVLGMIYLPALVHSAARGTELRRGVLELNLLLLAMTPAAFGLCLLLSPYMLSAFGAFYDDAFAVLVVLALAQMAYLSLPSGTLLWVLRKDRVVVGISLTAMCLHVVATTLLVPRFGALGVALATLGSLSAAKLGYAVAYRLFGLPLADRRHVLGALLIGAWGTALMTTSGPAFLATATAGTVASGLVTLRLLVTGRMFRAQA